MNDYPEGREVAEGYPNCMLFLHQAEKARIAGCLDEAILLAKSAENELSKFIAQLVEADRGQA